MDTGAGAQSGGFRVLIGRENHLIGAPGSFSGTLDSAKLWQTADHAMMDSTLDQSRKAAKLALRFVESGKWSVPLNQSRIRLAGRLSPAGLLATSGVNGYDTMTLKLGIFV